MPRKTKEPTKKEEQKLAKSKESKSKKTTTKTKLEPKKEATKKTATKTIKTSKNSTSKKEAKVAITSTKKVAKETKKATKAVKSTSKTTKTTSSKKAESTAKATKSTTKPASKKTVKNTKASTEKTKKASSTKKNVPKRATVKKELQKPMDFAPEYYDLPIKYNKTVVKILAQTPNNLFVYWEISDDDREALKNQYGKYFFEITKPVLIVFNETLNYSFEIDIDDFANSWYLHVNDSNSEYRIELGRRPIPINYNYMPEYKIEEQGPIKPIEIPYIHISSSNELDTPNDRILFNNKRTVYYRNVKTNQIIKKQIKNLRFAYKNGKFINLYKLYKELYGNEIFNNSINLNNPSSGNPSSGSFLVKYR